MKKNIGKQGQLMRYILALLIFIIAWSLHSWILLFIGLFVLFEALGSWCIVYHCLGKKNCSENCEDANNKKTKGGANEN